MRFLLGLVIFVVGCCGTSKFERPPSTGEPWDTTYLLDLDPAAVTPAALANAVSAAEARLQAATVEGVVWPRVRSSPTLLQPDQFMNGADSLLFSGVAAAAWSWRYMVTRAPEDRVLVLEAARGLHLLTHGSTPGVLCRCVLPLSRAAEFGWPWPHREPFVGTRAGYGWYTRATRDQLSGLVLGLASAWRALEGDGSPEATLARDILRVTGQDVMGKLASDDWRIRDADGKNDTNADGVDGILRLGLEAFVAVSGGGGDVEAVRWRVLDFLDSGWEGVTSWFNRFSNASQYYAHNLRVMRTLTLVMLSPHLGSDVTVALCDYAHYAWWRYVNEHKSAWFEAAWMAHGGDDRSTQVGWSLRSLSLRPSRDWASPWSGQYQPSGYLSALFNCTSGYVVAPHLRKPATGYFVWEKEPWDVGEHLDHEGLYEDSGLSLVAPYWLCRMAGGSP